MPLMTRKLKGRVHKGILINHTLHTLRQPSPVHILFLHFDGVGEVIFSTELENQRLYATLNQILRQNVLGLLLLCVFFRLLLFIFLFTIRLMQEECRFVLQRLFFSCDVFIQPNWQMCNNQQLITEYMSPCEIHGNQTDFRFPVIFLDSTYKLIYNKWCKIFRKKLGDISVVNFEEISDF